MNEIKLYVENREFEGEDGATVKFKQVMLQAAGITVPIKPVFKDDRRLLIALADRKE